MDEKEQAKTEQSEAIQRLVESLKFAQKGAMDLAHAASDPRNPLPALTRKAMDIFSELSQELRDL